MKTKIVLRQSCSLANKVVSFFFVRRLLNYPCKHQS